MTNNDFWYEHRSIPHEIKQKLCDETNGERVMELNSDGEDPSWLLSVDHEVFRKVFSINRNYLFKGNFTAPPNENDYVDSACYLSDDGLAGFAVTRDNWLVSMFSNQERRGFVRRVKPLITEKATKLVCIVSGEYSENKLANLYHHVLDFNAYARTENDSEIMKEYYGSNFVEDFVCHYGYPFHLFMIRTSKAEPVGSLYVFNDYFKAEAFVNARIK